MYHAAAAVAAAVAATAAAHRLAEVPPTAYPNQIAVALERLGGGNAEGSDDPRDRQQAVA